MEFFGTKIEDVTKRVPSLETVVATVTKENEALRQSCLELDEYKWRWNLRVAGVPESNIENVKQVVIHIFENVSPDSSLFLSKADIDIVHRL